MFQIFVDAHYDFVGKRRWFYIASLGAVALAILSIVLHGGLNYGIDFTGGALVQVRYDRPVNVGEVRRIESNEISDSRDTVAWYSNGNVFWKNKTVRSRYALHFMFAGHNVVDSNYYYDDSVGVYLMYTDGMEVRNNVISHSTGATGMGIGFKEASGAVVENNQIIYCSTGISSDLSPFQPDSTIGIKGNLIAYNAIGVMFNSDLTGNIFTGNAFEGNLSDVAVGGAGSSNRNEWRGNYWDEYQGFDRNNDGVADTPYELYAYSDQLWMEIPQARFFKSAPALEVLDFLERLAPFSSPTLLLRDEKPLFNNPWKERVSAEP